MHHSGGTGDAFWVGWNNIFNPDEHYYNGTHYSG
jgi:hypothetical protein